MKPSYRAELNRALTTGRSQNRLRNTNIIIGNSSKRKLITHNKIHTLSPPNIPEVVMNQSKRKTMTPETSQPAAQQKVEEETEHYQLTSSSELTRTQYTSTWKQSDTKHYAMTTTENTLNPRTAFKITFITRRNRHFNIEKPR